MNAEFGFFQQKGGRLNKDRAQDFPNSDLASRKTGRNELCPCGSGRKFKKCHGRF
ncbi:MAG: SEC-C metal-binding domain-containing protein [Rhodomicrobium sp.]